jgi:hypothetical protein
MGFNGSPPGWETGSAERCGDARGGGTRRPLFSVDWCGVLFPCHCADPPIPMFDHGRDDDDGGDVDELDGVAELDRHIQTLPSNGIYHSLLPQSRTLCQGPFFAAALNITNCST